VCVCVCVCVCVGENFQAAISFWFEIEAFRNDIISL